MQLCLRCSQAFMSVEKDAEDNLRPPSVFKTVALRISFTQCFESFLLIRKMRIPPYLSIKAMYLRRGCKCKLARQWHFNNVS